MPLDNITEKLKHEEFVRKVCETNIIYGLESDEGFATSSSNEFDDENGEPIEMICFWSHKKQATSCIKNNWAEYAVAEMPLSEFIENWCIGMNNDGLIIGTNFDENMSGFEIEPLELILELVKELRINKSDISFLEFDNLDDLEKQIKSAND